MIRALSSLLLLMAAVALSPAGLNAQESQTQTWKGALDARGTRLRLEIDITENRNRWSGELRSLDQNNEILKISKIQNNGKHLKFSVPSIGATFKGKLSKKGTLAKGTFNQNGIMLPLTITTAESADAEPDGKPSEKLKEAWVGKLRMGTDEPIMQFRIVTAESGETKAYFDSVTEGRTGFEATWSIGDNVLKFEVEEIKLTFQGALNDTRDHATGTWSQGGRALPLVLKKQAEAYLSRNTWENRPQRPVGPFPYREQEVQFENKIDGVVLAGTLTLPQQSGRHPVVVLISGSGPQDRNQSLKGHKPFLVLADYLTRRGIAVLRYDDRGTSQSTGKFSTATSEDFARDTSAAIEFLKNHDEINPEQIGLAGHSEGGLIAPMVVGLRDDIAFVALLAATGVDGMTISLTQTETALRALGTSKEEIKNELALNRAAMNVAKGPHSGADFSEELDKAIEAVIDTFPVSVQEETREKIRKEIEVSKKRLQRPWIRFFLGYDPRPALKNIKCPVLAITGSKDQQVLPEMNMPEIEKALTQGGNSDFKLVELPGLNHLFQECETGSISEYANIMETFNPKAMKCIGDWILEHTTPVQ